jgi:ribosomal protein S18 acetylase RimI-like enzyme
MEEIILKRATDQDVDKFIDIERSIGQLKTYSLMTDKEEALQEIDNNIVYFIILNNEIVGSVMYENKSNDHAYISGLVVNPKCQGRGIARQAMEVIMEELGEKKRIDLVTHPENDKAINLYQSLGFSIKGRKENYFGDGEPRVIMVKEN